MRIALFLVTIAGAWAQTSITFYPAVVTHCNSAGAGSGKVVWSYDGAGQVQVRVGSAAGKALTQPAGPHGSAPTGEVVTDGIIFVLTDAGGTELAETAPAIVRCNPAGEVLAPSLAGAPYFPLQPGDEWIYSYSSRINTNVYVMRKITGAIYVGDLAWFTVEESIGGGAQPSLSWYRNDDMGRIYQLTSQGAVLYLDPTTPPDPSAILKPTVGGPVQVPAGTFSNTLNYSIINGGLDLESGTFARGVGLVMNSHNMLSGSSGGFTEGMKLVYARIDGHVVFGSPMSSLELGVDASSLDVTNRKAANCAVPCYFVACYLAPGADPAGTYKPCFQARVNLGHTGFGRQQCDVDFLDSANQVLSHATVTGDFGSVQIPLYSAPNVPYQPGNYQVRAQTPDGRIAIAPVQLN